MQRRSLITGFLLAGGAVGAGFLAGILTRSSPKTADSSRDQALVMQLLSLTLKDANGNPFALRQWQNRTLIINYWATWCPPCRDEMPGFSRIAAANLEKKPQFVGIAIDTADNVREFSDKTPVSYPLLIADAEAIAIGKNLGNSTSALPFTVVANPDGSIREKRIGALKEAELLEILQR